MYYSNDGDYYKGKVSFLELMLNSENLDIFTDGIIVIGFSYQHFFH